MVRLLNSRHTKCKVELKHSYMGEVDDMLYFTVCGISYHTKNKRYKTLVSKNELRCTN